MYFLDNSFFSTNELTFINDDSNLPAHWITQPTLTYTPHLTTHLIDLETPIEASNILAATPSEPTFNTFNSLNNYPLTLKQFFILQNVDTPSLLKQRRSKFRTELTLPTTQLIGMLAKHGLHRRIRISYLWVYYTLVQQLLFPHVNLNQPQTTRSIINLIKSQPLQIDPASLPVKTLRLTQPVDYNNIYDIQPWRFNHNFDQNVIALETQTTINSFFFNHLKRYIPIFTMKTQKVDKMRFKHSRGKSGKYLVSWKYVPRYKRLGVVLRWLTEDITLQKASTFRLQILKAHQTLLTNPSNSLLNKNRNYVHKYVYTRYRNTLLRTLKKTH